MYHSLPEKALIIINKIKIKNNASLKLATPAVEYSSILLRPSHRHIFGLLSCTVLEHRYLHHTRSDDKDPLF